MPDVVAVDALAKWVDQFAALVNENREYLTSLDSAIGDADHGANMARGMTAAREAIEAAQPTSCGALLSKVGMTLVSTTGGASGPLFGTFFLRMGSVLGDSAEASPEQLGSSLRAGLEGIVARGRAEPGDKTMYDALAPAVDAFEKAVAHHGGLRPAAQQASAAAAAGRDATKAMLARKGRASYLGERSVGHIDPGAASIALLFDAAARTF